MATPVQHVSDALPYPRTRLIGREAEREFGRAFLLETAAPLLTLTGPGGVGKTRLALAIAHDVADAFADGVVWVDLAPLTDPALVPGTVAATLGLTADAEMGIGDRLRHALHTRQLLLLLDNCEHLLEAIAGVLGTLLAHCPALQVLATSRAPLLLRGEQRLPVEPLSWPAADAAFNAVVENDAVRLFTERSQAVRPSFTLTASNAASVAALCRQLDGLPLAIELAAARSAILSPGALLAQMTDRLHLLRGGMRELHPRQQTMAATIAWSYDLLRADERALFHGLAVFAGGFTLEAARAVAGPGGEAVEIIPTLERLVEQSLVRRVEGEDEPRFIILETIRAFALDRLAETDDEMVLRDRHAHYVRSEAHTAEADHDRQRSLAWIAKEQANIRAALAHLEGQRAIEPFLSLASDVAGFWTHFGLALEARGWLERGLARGGDIAAQPRAWALANLAGVLYQAPDQFATALDFGEQALRLAPAEDFRTRALAAHWCGLNAMLLGQPELADAYFQQSQHFEQLVSTPGQRRAIAHLDNLRAQAAMAQGDIDRGEQLFILARDSEREQERELGLFPSISYPITGLGHVARCRGQTAQALACYQEGLAIATRFRDVRILAPGLAGVAGALAALGRWREAAILFGATDAFCERTGVSFSERALPWQRAAGIPEPWQQEDAPRGWLGRLRDVVVAAGVLAPQPLARPDEAAQLWASGRSLSEEEAIAMALAIDPSASGTAPDPYARRQHADLSFMLTRREHQILGLLCQRFTDPEIAEHLFISPRTASRHVANIFAKLGVNSRREAAALATRQGLV